MNISILISKNSWANSYKKEIKTRLNKFAKKIVFLNDHKKINNNINVNIVFSYFRLIKKKYLDRVDYNIIPHESDLPKGKGMSPLTWQIIEGKKKIIFSLIEAAEQMDSGKIYLQKKVKIPENVLFKQIKEIQLQINLGLIESFLKKLKKNKLVKGRKQKGNSSFFRKRTPLDHKININKNIRSQFNILRTSDNKFYPSFFEYKNKKYKIIIKEL